MTMYHVCLSVRGALHRGDEALRGLFTKDDGTPLSIHDARELLMDHIQQGHEVIPMGCCDNFDFKTGCRGHEEGIK